MIFQVEKQEIQKGTALFTHTRTLTNISVHTRVIPEYTSKMALIHSQIWVD